MEKTMKKSQKALMLITSAISLIAVILCLMIVAGIDVKICNRAIISSEEYENFKDLKEIISLYEEIDRDYYQEIDRRSVSEGAIRGMFAILPDGYSRYFSKEELASKKLKDKGESIGIGIQLQRNKNKEFVIVDVLKNRPAEKAGLRIGDKIISVNDIELNDETYQEVLNSLKDQSKEYILFGKYIQAKIIILRNNEELIFYVDRDTVFEKSVEYNIEGDIGYIKINRFIETTFNDYSDAIEVAYKNDIKKLILDLRDNPGGLVDEASKIAGSIIGKNKVIYYTNSKKEKLKEHKSSTDKKYDFDIILLTNENSASASEILVGALKDYESAKIIGTTTFGKGIIQTTYSRLRGDGYQITTSEYLTPNKNEIHKKGIRPDIEIRPGEDELELAKELLTNENRK